MAKPHCALAVVVLATSCATVLTQPSTIETEVIPGAQRRDTTPTREVTLECAGTGDRIVCRADETQWCGRSRAETVIDREVVRRSTDTSAKVWAWGTAAALGATGAIVLADVPNVVDPDTRVDSNPVGRTGATRIGWSLVGAGTIALVIAAIDSLRALDSTRIVRKFEDIRPIGRDKCGLQRAVGRVVQLKLSPGGPSMVEAITNRDGDATLPLDILYLHASDLERPYGGPIVATGGGGPVSVPLTAFSAARFRQAWTTVRAKALTSHANAAAKALKAGELDGADTAVTAAEGLLAGMEDQPKLVARVQALRSEIERRQADEAAAEARREAEAERREERAARARGECSFSGYADVECELKLCSGIAARVARMSARRIGPDSEAGIAEMQQQWAQAIAAIDRYAGVLRRQGDRAGLALVQARVRSCLTPAWFRSYSN